jgi:type IV pilus assembly protein PilB
MTVSNEQLRKIVVDGGLVGLEDWEAAVLNAERRGRDTGEVLVERGLVGAQRLYDLLSEYLNVPYVDLRKEKIDFNVLKLLQEKTLLELQAVPFRMQDEGTIDVAFLRPQDTPSVDEVQKVTGYKVRPYLTSRKSFSYAMRLYQRDLGVELNRLIEETFPKGGRGRGRKGPPEYPVVRILDTVLTHAVMSNVSDIHLEPLSDALLVRFRIDGLLHDILELPAALAPALVSRVKVLTNLKIDEHRLPQDGRMAFFAETENIFIRVSVLPTFYGEKVVMRILNDQEQRLSLQDLGLEGRAREAVEEAVRRPRGLLLVVGPTGSGKTTTLYSLLGMLNTERVNIATIEDPIEYGLPRVNQTQVNPAVGYTFSTGLRALLRQDPNVIMVGEIRDEETADIAVQASLTGHLVLSTLHTVSAAGIVPRLIEMGIKPFVMTSTVSAAVAQRLVRKICPDCVEPYQPDEEQTRRLHDAFHATDLLEDLKRLGLIDRRVRSLRDLRLRRGRGCNQCRHEGYVGRVGVYEVMEMSRGVREAVLNGRSLDDIEAAARRDGMWTLAQDAWRKVLRGVTTVDELLRVIRD